MSFGTGFTKTFNQTLSLGANSYLSDKKDRIDVEQETQKRIAEINKKNKNTEAYAKLLGVDYDKDPVTGELRINTPEDFKFKVPNPSLQAELFPEMGNEYQQSFNSLMTQYQKDQKPPIYTNQQSVYDPKTKKGIVTGIDPNTHERVQIGIDPYYIPKKLESDVIEGVVTVGDQKFGQGGRRTRLITYEDGTYKTQDLGRVKTGDSSSNKPTSELAFELDMADLNEKVTNSKLKRQTYLTKKFANPDQRQQYLDGINAELNEIALSYGKLASPDGQKKILEIFHEGKKEIKSGRTDRQGFYKEKKNEIEQEYIANGDNNGKMFRDGSVILQFLDAKYNQWLPYEDSQADENSLEFDELDLKLE